MGIKHGVVESYHDDQMVVALPDLRLVKQSLAHSAAIVIGEIARRTRPGEVSAREVLEELLTTPVSAPNSQGGIIRPN